MALVMTVLLLYFRESTNPFVEQAIQFSVAAAKATIIDKERKDVVDKLLLQGCKASLSYFCCS
jgi:phosphomevalonate kinase